jgi:aminomethyltransferase
VSASSYDLTHEHEYHAIRSAAGLIDISPLYKYRIRGGDAETLANRVVTRDITKLAVGQVCYTPWCDSDGKVRDDGTLHRLADSDFRLTSAEPTLLWLHENAEGLKVEIEEETEQIGALALQGPRSLNILSDITDGPLAELCYFHVIQTQIGGIAVHISRTGYTGDLGYEIWVDASDAVPLWDTIVRNGVQHGLAPAGLLALDIVRVEAGLLLIDVDYMPAHRTVIDLRKSSPFELGLGWTVSLDKANYVGRTALREEQRRPAEWKFRGLEIDWVSLEDAYAEANLPPQIPGMTLRESVPLYAGGEQVGYATSRSWSPTVKKYLALAHVRAEYAEIGTELKIEVTVEHQRRKAIARVARTPFFDPERKRATLGVARTR